MAAVDEDALSDRRRQAQATLTLPITAAAFAGICKRIRGFERSREKR